MAAKRGFSFFSDVWHYREEATLIGLLEAIEISSSKVELRIYLQVRYGSGGDVDKKITVFSRSVDLFFGLSEYFRAPESVRLALSVLREALSEWQDHG